MPTTAATTARAEAITAALRATYQTADDQPSILHAAEFTTAWDANSITAMQHGGGWYKLPLAVQGILYKYTAALAEIADPGLTPVRLEREAGFAEKRAERHDESAAEAFAQAARYVDHETAENIRRTAGAHRQCAAEERVRVQLLRSVIAGLGQRVAA